MNRRVRALIVDDEPLARRTIEDLLRDDPEIEICGSCPDGATAVAVASRERPDLMFLDIQMPGMNGFEVLETLVERLEGAAPPFIIFVTAYDRFALRAFEFHALDYLLKPFSDERFAQALGHAKKEIGRSKAVELRQNLAALLHEYYRAEAVPGPSGERFVVKSGDRVAFVELKDIVWFEAADHYVLVHTERKSHICRESMSSLATRLDPNRFLRVHRSAIVNADFIEQLRTAARDQYELRLKTGKVLGVSRRRSKMLRELLKL